MANFQSIGGGGGYGVRKVKLTGTGATAVVLGSECQALVSITCTEIAGGVAALTVAIYDGATTYFLRNALAMTAKQSVLLDAGWVLNPGDEVRVTASIADNVDVIATVIERVNR